MTGPGLDQELIRMPEQYGSGTGLVQPRQPDACDRTWLRPGIIRMPEEYGSGMGLVQLRQLDA